MEIIFTRIYSYSCIIDIHAWLLIKIPQTQSQTINIKHVSNGTTRCWESIKLSMCLEYLSEEVY